MLPPAPDPSVNPVSADTYRDEAPGEQGETVLRIRVGNSVITHRLSREQALRSCEMLNAVEDVDDTDSETRQRYAG